MAKTAGFQLTRHLLRYNARIVVLNSYWLFVVPLVASQLVIFWHMAMASLHQGKAVYVAQTTELAAPLFAAFLCAHVLAPEYWNRLEDLVFSRPLSFTRTVVARLVTMMVFLAGVIALMLFVYKVGLKAEYDLRTVVLAGVPSVFFLSMLSLAVAAVWHSPVAGVAAGGAVWAVDATLGTRLNPLLTLHSYGLHLAAEQQSSDWLVSKALLLAAGLVCALVAARAVGRPAGPTKWQAVAKTGAVAFLMAAAYVGIGAAHQVHGLARREAHADPRALSDLRQAHRAVFVVYGRVPVAYLFGPTYARYIGYPVNSENPAGELLGGRQRLVDQLQAAAFGDPDSPWADNAYFELIRVAGGITEEAGAPKGEEEGELIDRRAALQYCRQFMQDYPASPYAPMVAERWLRMEGAVGDEAQFRAVYDLLIKTYSSSPSAAKAAQLAIQHYESRGETAQAIAAAEVAERSISAAADPDALLMVGDFLSAHDRPAIARRCYEQALQAVRAETEKLTQEQMKAGKLDDRDTAARTRLRGVARRAEDSLRRVAPRP